MRRVLTALIVAALAGGMLLMVATLSLDAWRGRLYNEAQALQSGNAESDAVIVENPYEIESAVSHYLPLYIASCAATTFWAVFIVLPSLLVSRHFFAGLTSSHVIASVVVCIVSGVAFAWMLWVAPYISPLVPFGAGGAIGLVILLLLVKMLPPNTSLERTRER